MPNILKYSKPIIVVDDTNLIFSCKYFDILQTNIHDDLYSITHWLFINKLTLHLKKPKLCSTIFEILNLKRN